MQGYELICVGNAIVDIIANVEDKLLLKLNLIKGSMKIVSDQEFNQILKEIKNHQIFSGGSAANTAVGFSSCGGKALFVGNVGKDEFGEKFGKNILDENVYFDTKLNISSSEPTSKSIILVTNDAERTMCTYLGASTKLSFSKIDKSIFDFTKIIYFEGYLFDKEETKNTIIQMSKRARSNGILVSLSLSDKFCVDRHRKDFFNLINDYVDFVFANESELTSLFEKDFKTSLQLLRKIVKFGAITLGEKGSIIFTEDKIINIKPIKTKVVDTTGAGDLFASGVLFGLSNNMSLKKCGQLGSICSGEIISHFGARPKLKLKAML